MRHILPIVFTMCTGFLLSAQKNDREGAARSIYLTKIEKNVQVAAIERFAAETFSIVLTHKPVADRPGIKAVLKPGEELLFVELHNPERVGDASNVISGELVRYGRMAFVKMERMFVTDAMHLGDVRNHIRVLDTSDAAPLLSGDVSTTDSSIIDMADLALDAVPIVPKETLKLWLEEFSGEKSFESPDGTRKIIDRGSVEGRKLARLWLAQKYKALGFAVSEHVYSGGKNFIAEKKGQDASKVFIVSAHLDSMNNAGADDDGAGTISTLAVATVLSSLQLKYNLRILGFDQEELGLLGSKAYAKKLKDDGSIKQVVGVLNLEMTAYDKDKDFGFHAIHCNENKSKDLADALAKAITGNNLTLKLISACTNRSDHASFWQYGVPAIVVAQNFFGPEQDSNPCYHKACDKVGILNFDFMHRLTSAAAYMAQDLLIAPQ